MQGLVLPELQHNRKDELLEDEDLRKALLSGQPAKSKKLAVFAKEVTTQAKFRRLSDAIVPQYLHIKETAVKLADQATETCFLIHVLESIISMRQADPSSRKTSVQKLRDEIARPLASGLLLLQSMVDALERLENEQAWIFRSVSKSVSK